MTAALEHYKAGLALFGKGENEQAITEYEKALVEKPDWEDALHGLAMAQANAGKLDEAIATGQRVAELNPDDPFAYTSLSMFYQRKSADAATAEERDAFIAEAEKQQNKARMASWKQELKTNPDAPPPEATGGMNVVQ